MIWIIPHCFQIFPFPISFRALLYLFGGVRHRAKGEDEGEGEIEEREEKISSTGSLAKRSQKQRAFSIIPSFWKVLIKLTQIGKIKSISLIHIV